MSRLRDYDELQPSGRLHDQMGSLFDAVLSARVAKFAPDQDANL
jgi:hypothetical protein